MRHQNHRCLIFLSHHQKFLYYLFLHRHIQCTGRFICKKKIRVHDHCSTDTHTLIHTPGKFKRITVQNTFIIIHTDFLHNLPCTSSSFFFRYSLMFGHRFMYLNPDFSYRAKCRLAVLKYHSNFCSQISAEFLFAHVGKIFTFIPDISFCYQTFLSQKSHDSFNDRTFSASGFSYDPKDFSLLQFKADILDCRFSIIADRDMIYFQQRIWHILLF